MIANMDWPRSERQGCCHHRWNRLNRRATASAGHQSRFHLILCLVACHLLATLAVGAAELTTAGIAGGGGPAPISVNTPLQQQPAEDAAPLVSSSDSSSNSSSSISGSVSSSADTNQRIQAAARDAFGVRWSALKYVNKGELGKKRYEKKASSGASSVVDLGDWQCPNVSQSSNLECGCDMPHTLRCRGDLHGLELIAEGLRASRYAVSLLDCTLKNVSVISDANIFENVSLQGLVISSGEIKRVHRMAFAGIKGGLQALGLPNNALVGVPMQSFVTLPQLDRLDLSNNRIKAIQNTDFISLPKLSYLELSENQISYLAPKSFIPLKNLIHLKLNGNRLGESPESMKAIESSLSLRELDLRSNTIRGPLKNTTLPMVKGLEILNLDKNSITSIQNGALEGLAYLQMLSLRHNQIDVLQDHAFSGLASLQVLDLGHNGIVAISGSSLKHLPRLIVLDLTHNFLRALTSDIVSPLPSLKELRLDGNDITIIAQNALFNATELHSLSLENNPLACDCSMKPFAEWLSTSRIASQDVLGAVCATPPHLEGASLLQITTDSMNCNGSGGKDRTAESTFRTIEVMLKLKNNMSYVRDISGDVQLKGINFTDESDVFLYWRMQTDDYSCRFVYVFHDDDPENILYNSEVSCNQMPELANATDYVFVTKLIGAYDLQSELSYKFCLIMKEDISKDEYLGACQIAILPVPNQNRTKSKSIKKELYSGSGKPGETDISDLNRIAEADRVDNEGDAGEDQSAYYDEMLMSRMADDPDTPFNRMRLEEAAAAKLPSVGVSRMVLEGLGAVIIVTSLMAFIWGFIRLKSGRSNIPSMSTCYTVDERRGTVGHEVESRSRYFKLQATTSL
ncbi:leucine-rich repeat-containing G-protein coupled receptor 4 isoform X2 [Culex pipiens pallens]|uniref:leucine-rich repeat-containing G-protein coupled receptor 4 isoform X2 n=1 Tax=Culex pipiens pallens TaxID=42434 RepID=UPI001953BD96|nr:leucine-rich repeat-containing G-protein coupled receptor 4 isoform X2 [Culex pipiens pallens]